MIFNILADDISTEKRWTYFFCFSCFQGLILRVINCLKSFKFRLQCKLPIVFDVTVLNHILMFCGKCNLSFKLGQYRTQNKSSFFLWWVKLDNYVYKIQRSCEVDNLKSNVKFVFMTFEHFYYLSRVLKTSLEDKL